MHDFSSCFFASVRCVPGRCCVVQERRRRLIPWWGVFGQNSRGGVAEDALAQSDTSLHVCVGKLVAAHGYRQKRENKLEIKK